MADYMAHWLKVGGQTDPEKLPRIFYVNWFRKDEDGRFLWPGFGENSRVLEWIFRRCDGEVQAVPTAIGHVPAPGDLNTEGLDISDRQLAALLAVDEDAVRAELPQVEEFLASFGDHLPAEMTAQLDALKAALGA